LCKYFYIYIVAHVSAPLSPLTTFSSILQITLFYAIILGDVNELNQIKSKTIKWATKNKYTLQTIEYIEQNNKIKEVKLNQ